MTDDATDDDFLGLDFATRHRIRCTSWELGTFQRGDHVRRQWALRMQRRDDDGTHRALAWLLDTNPGQTSVDWDWAIFLLARDAGDGQLSFDAYLEENLAPGDDGTIPRHEHQNWVRAEHVWHQVRDFLGRDTTLIASLFDISPPER
ncbi:hypothetical protein OHS18_13380 [Amycolatopsis sp. NBC_00355]|uniref:hypothetical protein n=1 Tax=Amycolatopsis sp. NBC_00355 TaxID=2975957 RepID=UPI002E2535E8